MTGDSNTTVTVNAIKVKMALSVYLRAEVPEKAINCMMQRGEFEKIVAYAQKVRSISSK